MEGRGGGGGGGWGGDKVGGGGIGRKLPNEKFQAIAAEHKFPHIRSDMNTQTS